LTRTSISSGPFITAAGAVAAIGAGSVVFSLAHHASEPGQQLQPTSVEHQVRVHHIHPTTSGGHVILGE
jgi:hypothetical protein